MRKLTAKQRLFVQEYLTDLNATDAARRAGYSEAYSIQAPAQLLTKPQVAQAIQDALSEREERVRVRAADVILQLARLGFSDIRKVFRWDGERAYLIPSDEIDDDTAAAIESIEATWTQVGDADGAPVYSVKLKAKMAKKMPALTSLMKHLGLFAPEKLDATVEHKVSFLEWMQGELEKRKQVGGGDE